MEHPRWPLRDFEDYAVDLTKHLQSKRSFADHGVSSRQGMSHVASGIGQCCVYLLVASGIGQCVCVCKCVCVSVCISGVPCTGWI